MNTKNLILFISLCTFKVGAQYPNMAIADSLYSVGNYSGAIHIYKNIKPQDQNILLQIAKAHKAKGTYTDALQYYRKVLLKNDELITAKVDYGRLLLATNNIVRADSIFTNLISKYPDNPNFQYQLGLTKEKKKDSAALNHFLKAFQLDTTHQKSCFKIAKHYLKQKTFDQVEKYANIGLASYPDNVALISILGQSYFKKGFWEECIPYFDRLLELNQENAFIHEKLAKAHNQIYEFEKSLNHYKLLLNYNSKDPSVHYNIAQVFVHLSHYKEAEKHFLLAIILKQQSLYHEYFELAMSYRQQEKWEDAILYMKKAISEKPSHYKAHYELALFADAYYKDPEIKLKYYNTYLKKFGHKEERFYIYVKEIVKKRIGQLEKEISSLHKVSNKE